MEQPMSCWKMSKDGDVHARRKLNVTVKYIEAIGVQNMQSWNSSHLWQLFKLRLEGEQFISGICAFDSKLVIYCGENVLAFLHNITDDIAIRW